MVSTAGVIMIWGLAALGNPVQSWLHHTAGGRMPLPSELLVETIRMDQAARMQRWQTERFEIEQQCRRDPEQCPPLFDVAPSLSRPPITEGVVVSPQDTNGGQASPAPDKRAE